MSSLEIVEDVVVGSCEICGKCGRVIVRYNGGKPSFRVCTSCYRKFVRGGKLDRDIAGEISFGKNFEKHCRVIQLF